MPNRILITGATGNIGGEVVRQLKPTDATFAVGGRGGQVAGMESISMDFADKASLVTAMQGASTLFMVIPNHPNMVEWGENVIEAAKESGISHVVRSSGSLANKDSSLMIERLLGTVDEHLRSSGLDYTITAPSFFMQNFINFFAEDYKNGAIYQPAGDRKMGWVDVRDIAAVNVEVLLNPKDYLGQSLTITGAESLSYGEAVHQMNASLGLESSFVAVPDEAAIEAMKAMHYPEFMIDLMISMNQSIRAGHAEEVTDTVEIVLGRPPIKFSQFIEDNREVWL
jgi:uncharacterized protein YbjT (DUF2867 family)